MTTKNLKADFDNLSKDHVAALNRITELEAQLTAAQGAGSVFADLLDVAAKGYARVNARAILAQEEAHCYDQQDGAEEEITFYDHFNFRRALEQVLDGLHKAVHGFDFRRNGAQQHYDGLKDVAEQEHAAMLEKIGNDRAKLLITDPQAPEVYGDNRHYHATIEALDMAAALQELMDKLVQVYDIACPNTDYLPTDERQAARKALAEERAQQREAVSASIDAMLARKRERRAG